MPGYDENFLDVPVAFPQFSPKLSSEVLRSDKLRDRIFADFDNYSVVTNLVRRSPVVAALNINQGKLKITTRKGWRLDKRVGGDFQLNDDYYVDNPWDKGHLAPREGAAWGRTLKIAQERADATFVYANAALQHENLNQDEWRGLESWVLELNLAKGGRVSSFTGPIYGSWNRQIAPDGRPAAAVPAAFFKVVCFVNKKKKKLDVRAFMMMHDRDAIANLDGRKTYNLQTYQVTIADIERFTGLLFQADVAEKNPLFYKDGPTAQNRNVKHFPERVEVNSKEDMLFEGEKRFAVKDDDVNVYIAAAMPNPKGKDTGKEWVSILNLTCCRAACLMASRSTYPMASA